MEQMHGGALLLSVVVLTEQGGGKRHFSSDLDLLINKILNLRCLSQKSLLGLVESQGINGVYVFFFYSEM